MGACQRRMPYFIWKYMEIHGNICSLWITMPFRKGDPKAGRKPGSKNKSRLTLDERAELHAAFTDSLWRRIEPLADRLYALGMDGDVYAIKLMLASLGIPARHAGVEVNQTMILNDEGKGLSGLLALAKQHRAEPPADHEPSYAELHPGAPEPVTPPVTPEPSATKWFVPMSELQRLAREMETEQAALNDQD